MACDTVTGWLVFTVYLPIVRYTSVWVCKRAPLWLVAAVVKALTFCSSHMGHECDSLIGMCERASVLRLCKIWTVDYHNFVIRLSIVPTCYLSFAFFEVV